MHGTIVAGVGGAQLDMMTLPRTLKGAERRLRKALKDPRKFPLSKLVEHIRSWDPSFKGLTEEQIFARAYGDDEQAARSYRVARAVGDDTCVRKFCIARLERYVANLLKEADGLPR